MLAPLLMTDGFLFPGDYCLLDFCVVGAAGVSGAGDGFVRPALVCDVAWQWIAG